jgi:hypothetical protein
VGGQLARFSVEKVFRHDLEQKGRSDYEFLAEMFHSLMLNYSWWINRKDTDGRDIFGGGFLGMDNIGVFDRDKPLPNGVTLEQSDGTSWMANFLFLPLTLLLSSSLSSSSLRFLWALCVSAVKRLHVFCFDLGHEDWPMPGNTAYCLSKGGMRMLTRTAGLELAPHKILVVGVGPGAVATPINLSTMKDPALMKKLDTAIPLGRMAKPEEIASVVAFLAGDGASYLTATTIFADGGLMHSSPGL